MLSIATLFTHGLISLASTLPLAQGSPTYSSYKLRNEPTNSTSIDPYPITGDTFVHDPTVVKTRNGSYLLAFTADGVGLKRSDDRVHWIDIGSAFPNGTPWTVPYTQTWKNLWAPDISYHNGQYYIYYSASTFGSRKSAIFLTTSPTGESGSWTNKGVVVETVENSTYNAIDANLVKDHKGQWWMSFGSFWSGIKMVQLNPKTGLRMDDKMISLAARPSEELEAPFIYQDKGWYYMWLSWDRCCRGRDSTYKIVVGRSKKVTGPYLDHDGVDMMDGGGTVMLETHGDILGPGHNAVFKDDDGHVLVYHYYNPEGVAQLGINRIKYDGKTAWPILF